MTMNARDLPLPADAFAHHPELRGKIKDPLTSYFRDFSVEALVQQHPELEDFRDWVLTDAVREANRRQCLSEHRQKDLWVFAYGSLMWDPAFAFVEVRHVFAEGVERRFILVDDRGGRGTKRTPGLMAALDTGEGCEGLAFRIAEPLVEAETERLWRREMIGPGYLPGFVTVRIDDQPTKALTFLADHSVTEICTGLSHDDQVRHIALGAGFLGTSRDYLANIVAQFAALDIVDEHCSTLLQEVDDFRGSQTLNGTAR